MNAAGEFDPDYDLGGKIKDDGPGLRRLVMVNAHTGERFDAEYVVDGRYVREAIEQFSIFARDWREDEVKTFNPATMDIIWKVWKLLDTSEPFRLNSGYRSPKTNASLPGAALQSLHMKAWAADLSMDSRTPNQVQAAAKSLRAGGVGSYSSFTHVDCGSLRYWRG